MTPNILHLITSLKIGGTETLVAALCHSQKSRYNVYAGYIKEPGDVLDDVRADGVPVQKFSGLLDLCRFLRRNQIHVLHTHLYRANILGRIAGALCRTPVIISSQHGIDLWRKPHHSLVDRSTARFADCILPDSEAAKTKLLTRERIAEDKIRVLRSCAVDPSTFVSKRTREEVRKELGVADNVTVLGCIARLHREKGMDRLVPLMKLIMARIPNIVVIVAGDGPLRDDLEREIQAAGLRDHVRILGWRRDIPDLLSAMDVFCLLSREESFPRVLLEAMLLRCPVAAMNVGGVSEAMAHETHGLLVPDGDLAGMAAAITTLVESREEAGEMADRGRERVMRKYTLDRMLADTELLYRELIDRKLKKS